MEKVKVEDAVGMVLCHDITEIVPGKYKGRAFAKGHIIQQEDIEKLLDLGKRHIYVWDTQFAVKSKRAKSNCVPLVMVC